MPQKKKDTKNNSGAGVDLLDREKSKNKIQPPSKYQVIYYNDDYTPMDLVTISLCHFFHHSIESATTIMMSVHKKGKGIAGGPYSKEIADTKSSNVVKFFRSQGYPLLAKSEKVE
tara:strand:+ start:1318 stop:1662 length:345 start_codon:yes stop_codon:yes gene_type:complete